MAQTIPVSNLRPHPHKPWTAYAFSAGQWLLALTLLVLPLIFSTRTQDQFELPKQLALRAFTSLLLGTLLVLMLADGALGWRKTALDWPILAWSLWLIACTLHSVSPSLSWRGEYENFAGSLTQLNYSALFFLTVQFIHSPGKAQFAVRALLASAVGAALYALMQALQRDCVVWSSVSVVSDRFFGSLGNPNFLGGFMAMAITLKLALILIGPRKDKSGDEESPWRWLVVGGWALTYLFAGRADLLDPFASHTQASASSGLVLLLWLATLIAAPVLRRRGRPRSAYGLSQGADLLLFFQTLANTATRGAFLGLMVGIGVLALGWLARRPSGSPAKGPMALRLGLGLSLSALVLVGAFAGLGPAFRQRTLDSLKNPSQALETSRLEIWLPALKIWRDHPIAGTGVDTFKTVFPSYSLSRFAKYDGENVSSRMAHCEPLQILATQGAVGLILWLWLCATAFRAWWRVLRQNQDPQAGAILLGLGPLAAAYLAQNLVSFGVAGISVPFWICLGLLFCTEGPAIRIEGAPKPSRFKLPALGPGPALALGGFLAIGGLWLDGTTLRADLDYAFANELQNELPSLDNASIGDLRGAVGFALNDIETLKSPLAPDLDAEVSLWKQGLADSETRLAQPGAEAALRPFYLRAAGALLMVLAAAHLREAVELCPNEVKYQVYLGLCYEGLFKNCDPQRRAVWFQAAGEAYLRSTEQNPGNAYYRGNLARLWSLGAENGNVDFFEKSQEYYLQAIALAPVTRLFYENLLSQQARFARLKDAGDLMDKMEARDKELAPILLIEGASTFLQYRNSSFPAWDTKTKIAALKAELDWTARAVALAPDNADYAFSLAVFKAQTGDRAGAAQWARKALMLNPSLDAARRFLAENHLE